MTNRRPLVVGCIVLAVVFVGLAALYFTTAAKDLPAFIPGHAAGSTRHHVKHGLAMLMLAAVSVVGAWMLSGPSARGAAGQNGPGRAG